jgi:hypothetical protein
MRTRGITRWVMGCAAIAGVASLFAQTAVAGEKPPPGAAVTYQIPVDAPLGEAQVLSLGVADLPVPSLIGRERLVHWRVVAHNEQDPRTWVLDARDQLLHLSDGLVLAPLFAEASTGGGGTVTLPPGQEAYLDLFFSVDGAADPPTAALSWRVRRGSTAIAARTVFERLPDMGFRYAHYRPAQYEGGSLRFGSPWCRPAYPGADWIRPFAGYCDYSYAPWADGFAIARGDRRWNYQRIRASETGPADSVRDRWRARSTETAGPRALVLDTPVPPARPDPGRWQWRLQQLVQRPGGSSVVVDSGVTGRSNALSPASEAAAARTTSPSRSSTSAPSPAPAPSRGGSVGRRWRR